MPRYGTPSWEPTSKIEQTAGCESREIVLASRSNRSRISSSAAFFAGRTLTATSRPRWESRAR